MAAALFKQVDANCGYAYVETALAPRVNCTATAPCLPGQEVIETACGLADCLPLCSTTENATYPSTTHGMLDCGEAELTCGFEGHGTVTFHVECEQPGLVEVPACGGVVDCTPHVCTTPPSEQPTTAPSLTPSNAPSRMPTPPTTRMPTRSPTTQAPTAQADAREFSGLEVLGIAVGGFAALGCTSAVAISVAHGVDRRKEQRVARARLANVQMVDAPRHQNVPALQVDVRAREPSVVVLPHGAANPSPADRSAHSLQASPPPYQEDMALAPPAYGEENV
ncbi:MAG: hypothetical protein H7255_17315 [Ramlibacter sp.]|nr:hypothetical protein [Ramlibacter sp.]